MSEPVWLTVELVIAFHDEQLRMFGGPTGIRDRALLESAVARAQNKLSYGETELAPLAAAYAVGIAKNPPFIDGNKRASFLALVVFLGLNGVRFEVPESEAAAAILALAAGELDEAALARWIGGRLAAQAQTLHAHRVCLATQARDAPYLSISPNTMSRLPRMADTSASICPRLM